MCGRGAVDRDVEFEGAGLRDAFDLAYQPVGLEPHVQCAVASTGAVMVTGTGSNIVAFVAEIQQRPDGSCWGVGQSMSPAAAPGGRRPREAGRQARVAGVLPVGMPVRDVLELQAQPQLLAGRDAQRRVRDEFGTHLLGLHDIAGVRAAGQRDLQPPPSTGTSLAFRA